MNKNNIKYFIDIGLVISFTLSFITGVIKFPQFSGFFGFIYQSIPRYLVSKIHDWSGLAMGLLILAHLILNFRWIICMTKNIFKKKKVCER